ncbi:hypothetical protein [Streptomyces sp. NBC_00140]|uniref:hypothetical protein n=1 Tax=Streptomyces sp. NBC_00140 TaxID=2975664 RepID=UPI0022521C97|nr:hypothetical protein [Streptomyces sp. NBC_00140]MCX5331841.1 hypothetical protein [Streptomyces sp. NBC_00140]
MGEGRSGGGVPGRRHVHPGGTGSPDADGADGLETLLAAAMRADAAPRANRAGDEGERHAVAAFRAARDAGEHRARTRRRDDWRPREQRRVSRSLRTTLSVFLASLTLGGVAFATIGTGGSSPEAEKKDPPRPRTSAPVRQPNTTAPATESPSAQPDRPVTAQDTEAHCRAYEKVRGRGNALNSTAWQRLVDAAGGEGNVAQYCADQLAQGKKADEPGKSEKNAGNTAGKKKQ